MMKLAFSTNAFVKYSLESAITKIANTGYNAVEILADKPHAFFPMRKNKVLNIKKALKKNNVKVSNINANTATGFFDHGICDDPFEPSLSGNDEDRRRWRINYTKQAIDFAAVINANNISVTSGRSVHKGRKESMERFIDSMHELVKYASARKINIGMSMNQACL